jgi:hypothetical protein
MKPEQILALDNAATLGLASHADEIRVLEFGLARAYQDSPALRLGGIDG